jgi:hypothetical protein
MIRKNSQKTLAPRNCAPKVRAPSTRTGSAGDEWEIDLFHKKCSTVHHCERHITDPVRPEVGEVNLQDGFASLPF